MTMNYDTEAMMCMLCKGRKGAPFVRPLTHMCPKD